MYDWPWKIETDPDTYDNSIIWPKISIITPSFNQGSFIEETIRSVLGQNYPNYEYFIVDGGSTDNTIEIIKKYDSFINKWVSEKDDGQSDALNKAFDWCTGDLLCYINSDDFFLKDAFFKIGELYKNLDIKEISILSGNTISVNQNSIRNKDQKKSYLPFQSPLDLTLKDHSSWYLPQPSLFFIRDKILETGFFVKKQLHFQMDRELIYRLLKRGKLVIVDEDIATFRTHKGSKTTGGNSILQSFLETPKAFSDFFNGNQQEDKLRKKVMYSRVAAGYYFSSRRQKNAFVSLTYLLKALMYNPRYFIKRSFWITIMKAVLKID
jgi:glycosyltransferase involved in cell wall biosynthesis